MFEKEAEEYANHNDWFEFSANVDKIGNAIRTKMERAYIAGAEFGYNKANEWHYPSKGEYPKEHQLVLGIFQNSEYYTPTELVYYSKTLDCWSNQMGDSEYHNVVAWKEIVLPELPKESE